MKNGKDSNMGQNISRVDSIVEDIIGNSEPLSFSGQYDFLAGAAIGDIIGSRYEFAPIKTPDFSYDWKKCDFTDDTVCTVAIADALLGEKSFVESLRSWCRKYPSPMGGYGGMFQDWLYQENPAPYNSWGNGAAMRISAVGWAFDTMPETLKYAELATAITHNHAEGIKGAQATAACIFLARQGKDKSEIRDYVEQTFGYNLHRTCNEIRPHYTFDGSCQGTVPESVICFLESADFEHAIRLAVSLGGDADTMGAITGAIAEAYYREIPSELISRARNILPPDLMEVLNRFYVRYLKK